MSKGAYPPTARSNASWHASSIYNANSCASSCLPGRKPFERPRKGKALIEHRDHAVRRDYDERTHRYPKDRIRTSEHAFSLKRNLSPIITIHAPPPWTKLCVTAQQKQSRNARLKMHLGTWPRATRSCVLTKQGESSLTSSDCIYRVDGTMTRLTQLA